MDTIVYNRDGAAAYADRYALSYNPNVVRFGADCANFVSQSARGGGMPTAPATWDAGWWYNNKSTSSPSDDQYSLSWINVGKQMSFWNGTRTDWVPGISYLGKGDAVYYDWSGDGVWDHVAIVTGTNSAGQKVIDAHTTDHYHVFWKLGYSTTQYKFGRVRPQWIV
jgi:cell wall-associated NlpC family hydrolase